MVHDKRKSPQRETAGHLLGALNGASVGPAQHQGSDGILIATRSSICRDLDTRAPALPPLGKAPEQQPLWSHLFNWVLSPLSTSGFGPPNLWEEMHGVSRMKNHLFHSPAMPVV